MALTMDHYYLALLARIKARGGSIPKAQMKGHDVFMATRMVRLQYLTFRNLIYELTPSGERLAALYEPPKEPEPVPEIIP